MRLYWSTRSIPELADLPWIDRNRVWWRCFRRSRGLWLLWSTWVVVCFAAGLGGYLLIWMYAKNRIGLPLFVGTTILSTAVGGALLGHLSISKMRPHLDHERHGYCHRCGYDLRGHDHASCPECGVELGAS
ncbi:MAG: hypothetical protein CMJ18_01975 [Phycisphaeraceae bacterium]|nr:hypothetical protein [Phycisphaeraceae bacterium]